MKLCGICEEVTKSKYCETCTRRIVNGNRKIKEVLKRKEELNNE